MLPQPARCPLASLPCARQVGLFDIVAKQARPVLVVHLVYMATTMWISSKYSEYLGLTRGR